MKSVTKSEFEVRQLQAQIEIVKKSLRPEALILDGCVAISDLIEMFFYYLEQKVDKKMHEVTEKLKVAEKDVKKGQPKAAVKVLKSAEKKNEKLVKIDKNVRDPIIKKYNKIKTKLPKNFGKVK